MAYEDLHDNDLIVNLTIDGTEYEGIEVRVTNPDKTIREQIENIIRVFELPKTDICNHPIQYLLGRMLEDEDEPAILDFEDENGRELSLRDHNVLSGDYLHLLSIPAYACPIPKEMEKEEYYEDDFIINLTIDGTSYEDIEVKVTNPNKTIREQIASIVRVFELPKMDCGGNPIQYLLGQMLEDCEEPEILDFEDEDGREQCLMDYNIQTGDNLHLIPVPIAGYACPVPDDMEQLWKEYYLNND